VGGLEYVEVGIDDHTRVHQLPRRPHLAINSVLVTSQTIASVVAEYQDHSSCEPSSKYLCPEQACVESFIPKANAIEVWTGMKYLPRVFLVQNAEEHHREGSESNVKKLVEPLVIKSLPTECV